MTVIVGYTNNRFCVGALALTVFGSATGVCAAADAAGGGDSPPYLQASLPVAKRVDDLVGRMTMEEKISQLNNDAHAIPRLHVPGYNYWNEALHGVARDGIATVFPQAIGIAATFDTPLIKNMARTLPGRPGPSTTSRCAAAM